MGKPRILGAKAESARAPTLVRATLTLLAGGALAQLVPLLLGPLLARLFTPQAMGVFTQFSTIAASLAVAASLRYEQALPLAVVDARAQALLALALRLVALAVLLCVPLAWLLQAGGWLPLPHWLPLAVGTAGVLQVLMLWANRAQRFGALAASRVLNYAGAAVLQVGLGLWLWQGAASGAQAAWALVTQVDTGRAAQAVAHFVHQRIGHVQYQHGIGDKAQGAVIEHQADTAEQALVLPLLHLLQHLVVMRADLFGEVVVIRTRYIVRAEVSRSSMHEFAG